MGSDPYILHILQATHIQPVSRLQSLLSNTLGSSYISDNGCSNVTYIELYMSSAVGIVCVLLFGVYPELYWVVSWVLCAFCSLERTHY